MTARTSQVRSALLQFQRVAHPKLSRFMLMAVYGRQRLFVVLRRSMNTTASSAVTMADRARAGHRTPPRRLRRTKLTPLSLRRTIRLTSRHTSHIFPRP